MQAATGGSAQLGRLENLDALRSAACLLVLSSHVVFEYILRHFPSSPLVSNSLAVFVLGNGGLGVQIFFGLSGFLITSLLLIELRNTGTLDLAKFYMRRVLRIWPVYFLVVLFVFLVYGTVKAKLGHASGIEENWVMAVLFLSNFDLIRILEKGTGNANGMLSLTWSVSVEEQFYLFWPILLLAMGTRYIRPALILIAVTSLIFAAITPSTYRVYYHSVSNAIFLAAGALLAYECQSGSALFTWARRIPGWAWLSFAAAMVAGLALLKKPLLEMPSGMAIYTAWAASGIFALLLHQLVHRDFGLGRVTWLVRLAKYTYGAYMYHRIAGVTCSSLAFGLMKLPDTPAVGALVAAASLAATLAMSILSFRAMEAPLLSIKRRFEPQFAR